MVNFSIGPMTELVLSFLLGNLDKFRTSYNPGLLFTTLWTIVHQFHKRTVHLEVGRWFWWGQRKFPKRFFPRQPLPNKHFLFNQGGLSNIFLWQASPNREAVWIFPLDIAAPLKIPREMPSKFFQFSLRPLMSTFENSSWQWYRDVKCN